MGENTETTENNRKTLNLHSCNQMTNTNLTEIKRQVTNLHQSQGLLPTGNGEPSIASTESHPADTLAALDKKHRSDIETPMQFIDEESASSEPIILEQSILSTETVNVEQDESGEIVHEKVVTEGLLQNPDGTTDSIIITEIKSSRRPSRKPSTMISAAAPEVILTGTVAPEYSCDPSHKTSSATGVDVRFPSKTNTMKSSRSIREHEAYAEYTGTPVSAVENPALLNEDIESSPRSGRSKSKKKKNGNPFSRMMRSLSRNRRGGKDGKKNGENDEDSCPTGCRNKRSKSLWRRMLNKD